MAGRKIRDAAEARASLAEAESSGLERAEWARRAGIDARSLNAWRLNLERREARAPGVGFVELVPSGCFDGPSARYVVRCGALEVEVSDDFDDATLHRLLRVVAAC